jgi:ketosteroid isomerase-like protein
MADHGEVGAAREQWMANIGRRDWRAVFAQVSDDGVFSSPVLERSLVGRDSIDAWVDTWADDPTEIDVEWTVVDGHRMAVGWRQRFPSELPPDQQPSFRGVAALVYAGGGRFSSFENVFDTRQAEASGTLARPSKAAGQLVADGATNMGAPPVADRREVLEALEPWTAKRDGRDWRTLFALLSDDAVVSSPVLDQPIIGRAALDAWTDAFTDGLSELDVEWVVVEGLRVAAGWRERRLDGRAPEEQPSFRGVATLVYGGGGRFSSFENFFDTRQGEGAYGVGPGA